ncbi:MAG: glycosyl hydrolase [Marinilabiliaceae bacterium]|jgi:hypothetical protein|nr:glycosyl hydrolase [Marinilabiliaceae bacterium]
MKRRSFINRGLVLTGGTLLGASIPFACRNPGPSATLSIDELHKIFMNPEPAYHPFVRWWWNGNMVKREEIKRELLLLKEAGIGGVEINPIEFPHRVNGDDLGIEGHKWLSKEWIGLLDYTLEEAAKLNLSCDLIVGSGWPFGSENLVPGERAEVILLHVDHIEGPAVFEKNKQEVFNIVDPRVTVPNPEREFQLQSLLLVPDPVSSTSDSDNLSHLINNDVIKLKVPKGKYALYWLVNVKSFASVINGAPGAAGSILNHMDKKAVRSYLDNMSQSIENNIGPLAGRLRSFFCDSMELEGCNWNSDLPAEFLKRRGYDINPWLPYILFKVGRLGGVIDDKYGVKKTPEFEEQCNRARYDFELTKAELLHERFTLTFLEWCRDTGVKSRSQAYGRGFFPLESGLGYDIPEGESWTTNWLKHRVGEEMPDEDYRRGRAYTMINKYVSSAAHLAGTRTVSCEEMTNTYLVFNTSLERLKNGSDQSIISGITHSVWHGFNYSPPEAPYPGWIQYGSYLNENNNWWPWFKYLNKYKARISALLQNSGFFSDIAILPANADLWAEMGVQTDPFPEKLNVPYTSLLWEAICKNGGASDYISELILKKAEIKKGCLCFGSKSFGTIFLPGVKSITAESALKLLELVESGGKVFCIETIPYKSTGLKDYITTDSQVKEIFESISEYKDNFFLLSKPENESYLEWYNKIQEKYSLPKYLDIDNPDPYLMQVRYQGPQKSEIFFFSNSNITRSYSGMVVFDRKIVKGKSAMIWDPESGERQSLEIGKENDFLLELGPAESLIIIFENNPGQKVSGTPDQDYNLMGELKGPWKLIFSHCRNIEYNSITINSLQDLSELEEYKHFSGTISYNTTLDIDTEVPVIMDLGKVCDIAELYINGELCGTKWYGKRIYKTKEYLKPGRNEIEIKIVTLMGNYMKSLVDNPNAQYWTNLQRKNQEYTPLGLIGPVQLYS